MKLQASVLAQKRTELALGQRRLVRFWWLNLLMANGLVGLALFYGMYRWHVSGVGRTFVWTVGPAWAVVAWTRRRLARHQRLVAGFEQPFAEEILQRAKESGEPFALFLRSFDAEAALNRYTGVNEDSTLRDAQLGTRPVEAAVISAIPYPTIALTDPRMPEPMPGASRFSHVPEDWETLVSDLANRAIITVMHLTHATPGIVIELERLVAPARHRVLLIKADSLEVAPELMGNYPHQILEGKGSRWTRVSEREFHKRLTTALHRILPEHRRQTSVANCWKEIPLTIASPWVSFLQFFAGPLIASVVLFLVIAGLTAVQSPETSRDETVQILRWLPFVFLAVAALKGWFLLQRKASEAGKKSAERMFASKAAGIPQHLHTQPPPLPPKLPQK